MRKMIGFLTTGITIYAFILILMYLFQEKMLFFPQPLPPLNYRQYHSEFEITIKNGDVKLVGWFIKGEISEKKPLIIYFGGNAEEVSGNLPSIDRYKNESFLFINYRGYGDSEGRPGQKELFADALVIYDEIVKREQLSPEHIVLLGRSLGSGVAVHLADQRPVKAIILVTAFDKLADVAQSHYPIFPVKWLLKHPFDSVKTAARVRQPALNIMAENDRIIPNRFSENLMRNWGGPTTSVLIRGADHNDIDMYDEYWDAINNFLDIETEK